MFTCRDYTGQLHENNSESLKLKFFPIHKLPPIWKNQEQEFKDLLSKQKAPFIR